MLPYRQSQQLFTIDPLEFAERCNPLQATIRDRSRRKNMDQSSKASSHWGLPSNKKLLKNNIKEKHAAINGLRSKNQGSSVAESLSNNSLCLILTSKNADYVIKKFGPFFML